VDASWLDLGLLADVPSKALKYFLEFNIENPGLVPGFLVKVDLD